MARQPLPSPEKDVQSAGEILLDLQREREESVSIQPQPKYSLQYRLFLRHLILHRNRIAV